MRIITYMLSEPVARQILAQTGQIPSNPKVEITDTGENERLYQAVTRVNNAGNIVETPDNIWSLADKTIYGESVRLYLKEEISLQEFAKRME